MYRASAALSASDCRHANRRVPLSVGSSPRPPVKTRFGGSTSSPHRSLVPVTRFQSEFPLSDRELLERLRKGDTTAFDAIFRTWYGPLVGTAERMLRDRAVAEELVQDVLLELWRRRESLAAEGSPQAYLFQATRNRVLNHLRHLKIEQRSEPELQTDSASAPHADAEVTQEELSVAVQDAVRSLPDRCREVFELSRVHGLKYAEIAAQLGISVKTVEAQMGKALRTLRERLAPWLPDS
jgi:RNA polymerase sigma-70 factor (ECF subfamily)